MHHRTVFTDEAVEECRLPDVRPPDDRDVEDAVVDRRGFRSRLLVLVGRRGSRQGGDNRVEQFAREPSVHRRQRHRLAQPEPLERPNVDLAPLVVDLVDDDDDRRARVLEQTRDLRILLGDPGRDVDDEEDEIGDPHGLGGLRAHLGSEHRLLTGEAGVAFGQPPAGVNDEEAAPGPLGRQLPAIARDPRPLLDDRRAATDDAVHKSRFSDVRAPDDRDDGERRAHVAGRRSARTSAAPSVGTISTTRGRCTAVVPSRKRPRDRATSGRR